MKTVSHEVTLKILSSLYIILRKDPKGHVVIVLKAYIQRRVTATG